MPNYREQKMEELVKHLAAEFLLRESSGLSLITVTNSRVFDHFKRVTVFISVLPEDKEDAALDFAQRKRGEFREYVRTRAKMRNVPTMDFEIDIGEKNRQRIDEIGGSAT